MQGHGIGHRSSEPRPQQGRGARLVAVVMALQRRRVGLAVEQVADVMQPGRRLQRRAGLGPQRELAALPGVLPLRDALAGVLQMPQALEQRHHVVAMFHAGSLAAPGADCMTAPFHHHFTSSPYAGRHEPE